jgi:hypothetical protein
VGDCRHLGACRYVGIVVTAARSAVSGQSSTASLVCVGRDGRPDFYALLYRRAAPIFFAFDVLSVDGRDPLIARKRALRRLVPRMPTPSATSSTSWEWGLSLYREVCAGDLRGHPMPGGTTLARRACVDCRDTGSEGRKGMTFREFIGS